MRAAFLAFNGAVLAFLLLPVALVVLFALDPQASMSFPPTGLSLRWYVKFFHDSTLMDALGFSLELAAATVVIAGAIGTAAALALSRERVPGREALTSLFLSPLVLPGLLTGFAMFQLVMVLDIGRSTAILLAGHVVVAIPYVIRTVLAVLAQTDQCVEEAARGLGASPGRAFREVTLPAIRPGIVAGSLFAFITSFDQFPISLFLVAPGQETLPIAMFNYLRFELDGAIAAGATVSILLAVLIVLAIERSLGLGDYAKL